MECRYTGNGLDCSTLKGQYHDHAITAHTLPYYLRRPDFRQQAGPFNFSTLSTKAYEYANILMLREASFPALLIVICGLLPVYIFWT
ncbi:MAG: hypothetical protein IPI00_16435 [Flavobacteriales bacterium]|nr:hypothetical protein [Flavobacteriales bacterium]MBK6945596.1 hypothetical protein [Flavobacteriales bacterium]MBK7241711.1 hypothetical protein [Flavobacteriales bacterium]MBK7296298.1 hypothetical protein [Flavobacteriales bacterium]MBK9534850.1 hypothetical protein [Flavobacteriales bacterium]